VIADHHPMTPPLALVPPRRSHRGPHWSGAEDAILIAAYGQQPAAALAARIGRTTVSVRQRARVLGLAQPVTARIRWTAAADAVLHAHYGQRTARALAVDLGTTEAAVFARARVLGLAKAGINRPWTADEDRLIGELYGALPIPALAERLGRSYDSVTNRLQTLGLTRETTVARREQRDQDTITQLRGEVQRLRDRPPPDAAHAPSDDARRLAVLISWRLQVISAAQAAVVLGVPVERLPVELGRAAARGLDVVTQALGQEG
jgi:hypothetical protein